MEIRLSCVVVKWEDDSNEAIVTLYPCWTNLWYVGYSNEEDILWYYAEAFF